MPHLGLGKRAIMLRMLKLRDLGILIHYTKKEVEDIVEHLNCRVGDKFEKYLKQKKYLCYNLY